MKKEVSRKSGQTPSPLPPVRGVLQRKCACGNHTVAGGECKECAKKSMNLQRKPTNQNEVGEIPPIVQEVLRSPGQLLDAETRALAEPRFGHDFSQVRLHTDVKAAESARAVNALAYTVGRDVVFGEGQYAPTTSEGRQLMAHELTHVAQQSNTSNIQLQTMGGSDALEAEADHSASLIDAETSPSMQTSAPLHASGTRLQMKPKATPISPPLYFEMIISFVSVMTDADARDALEQFRKMTKAQRKKAFEDNYASGAISKLLKAVSPEDAAGDYRDEVRQLLRWIEEAETRASSGKSDDEMAELKGKDMKAKAEADAKAAKAASGSKAAPTAADVDKAQQADVQETSVTPPITNRWDKLTPRKRIEMTKEGEKAIDDMVAYASKTHPELKLTKASFKLDFHGVDDRGQGVLAMGGEGKKGKPVAVVGFDFVTAVKVKPAYALSTVVHEVFGHPEYGKYGTEYHLSLYDKAVKKAGFKKKAEGTRARTIELDAYALQETEIYALMRELPFWTEVSPADETASPGLTELNYNPRKGITSAIGNIKTQWHDVKLAIPILHGLYARLRNDPRIAKMSLDEFKEILKAHFTEDEIKEIVK